MDICKYYYKDQGVEYVFNSDAELTEFIKNSLELKNNAREDVKELFESDKKLADEIYEAVGVKSNLKPVYSAVFFDTNKIVSDYNQIHKNLFSHHSTIEFKPEDISNLEIGKKVNIQIIGRLTTDKVDVLLVKNPLSKNKYPHITLSTAEGIKPFESNLEIEHNLDKVVPIEDTITGTIGVFDGTSEIINDISQDKIKAQELYSKYINIIFPDSKVKNIVYHGTSFIFDTFSKEYLGTTTNSSSAKLGFYFASNKNNSLVYGEDIERDIFDLFKNKQATEEIIDDFKNSKGEMFSYMGNYLLPKIGESNVDIYDNSNYEGRFSLHPGLEDVIEEYIHYINNKYNTNVEINEYSINLLFKFDEDRDYKLNGEIYKVHRDIHHPILKHILLDIKNPKMYSDNGNDFRDETYYDRVKKAKNELFDSAIIQDTYDPLLTDVFIVFEPEQIHILGSKQDIDGFKKFLLGNVKTAGIFNMPTNPDLIVETYDKPASTTSGKSNLAISIALKNKPDQKFELVKDWESGNYSAHFKTSGPTALTSLEKDILFKELADMIPEGSRISTWGNLTPGGVAGIKRFGKMDQFEQIAEIRKVSDKLGKPLDIPIFVKKKESKYRVKFSKIDAGLETKQEKVFNTIKKLTSSEPYNPSFLKSKEFLEMEHSIGGSTPQLLSSFFGNKNYLEKRSEELINTDPELINLNKIDSKSALLKANKIAQAEIDEDAKMKDVSITNGSMMQKLILAKSEAQAKLILSKELPILLDVIKKYNKNKDVEFDLIRLTDKYIAWYKYLKNSGFLFSSPVFLNKSINIGAAFGITSIIPILSVDKNGVPNIYRIVTSRNDFNNWHSSKIHKNDYELGINRQLLKNYMPENSSVDSSGLFLINCVFPVNDSGEIDIDKIILNDPMERSTITAEKSSGLDESGKITEKLNILLPAKTKSSDSESQILTDKISKILSIVFGSYDFKSKFTLKNYEKRYKEIIENADKNKYTKLSYSNNLENKIIQFDNNEEGRKKLLESLELYYEEFNKNKHSALMDILKNIKVAKANPDPNKNNIKIEGNVSDTYQKIFNKYLNPEWEIVDERKELLNLGILLFRNHRTKIVEAVSVTINSLDNIVNLGFGNTILGKFYKDSIFKNDLNIWSASGSHIETIKVLTTLNEIPEVMSGFTLGKIKIFNNLDNTSDVVLIDKALYNFEKIMHEVNKCDSSKINNFSSKNSKLKVGSVIDILRTDILDILNTNPQLKITEKLLNENFESLDSKYEKYKYFLNLQKILLDNYKYLNNFDSLKHINDVSDPIMQLFYLIQDGIKYYGGFIEEFDHDIPKLGVSSADALHWFKSVITGESPTRDKDGNLIVGFLQGTDFKTTDALKSQYTTRIHDLIALVQNKISFDYNKIKNIITKTTKEMYNELGRSDLEKMLIGIADKHHEVFFEHDGGKISQDFKLKNPWDMKSNLNNLQRKYLKKYIYFMYLYGKNPDLSLDTFEKFEKSEVVLSLKINSDNKLLFPPLIKKQSASRMKTITSEGLWKYIGNKVDDTMSSLDIRDLTEDEKKSEIEQKLGAFNSINKLGKMYNRFDSQESKEFRKHLIDKHGVDNFEVNMDTICLKFSYENLREQKFNDILPVINAAVITLKFHGYQSGKSEETDKAIETLFDQINLSIFGTSPIQGKEYEKFFAVVKSAQKLTSFMTLAFRPVSLIKELVTGVIKNVSFAWSGVYGDDSFESKHLIDAYGKLMKSKEDYNLTNSLNDFYRIANRDIGQLVDKTKTDRHGLNFFSNFMYWSNTAPDHINRLSLFVAKMLKDGCYDAHKTDEDGNLIYDCTKDERFSYYLSKRNEYGKDFHKSDEKYNNQKGLYLAMIDEFNGEIISDSEKKLTENDLLPRAYTHKQLESIKTFTETAYGYYDFERSPLVKHLPMGILFGQFMTFWPAKMKYYWGNPGEISKRGRMVQDYDIIDGEKKYFYLKSELDEETGKVITKKVLESELGPNDPKAKAWKWEGDLSEGLMYSLGFTIRELAKGGDINSLDPRTIKQAKLMLHDLMVALMSILIGILLFSDAKKSVKKGDGSTSVWDEMGQYERIGSKILMRSTSEFNPFTLLSDIQSTPAFIDKLSKSASDAKAVFEGDSDLEKFFRRNINFLELMPNPMTK